MNRRQFLKASTLASLSTLVSQAVHAQESDLASGLYVVSFYGLKDGFGTDIDKRLTANGELFNPQEYTCAHRTLPFGTHVRILNPHNNKEVEARVNDRGPYVKGRELDVSYKVAQELDFLDKGTLIAHLEIVPLCR